MSKDNEDWGHCATCGVSGNGVGMDLREEGARCFQCCRHNAPTNATRDKFTVEAGRGICLNGTRILTITRDGTNIMPHEADQLTRLIVKLLNENERKP